VPQQFTATDADVVIIGGGVIGLSIARALSLRGVRVVVLERANFGREASWAAGGILAPQVEADSSNDFLALACASRDLYPEFAKALFAETSIDIELNTTGTIYVAFSEAEERDFRARFEWQRRAGLAVEWLDAAEVRLVEPAVSQNIRCALRFPNDYQVENRRLVEALVSSNRRLGAQLVDHCEVRNVSVADARICGVETSNGFIQASAAVIAAGAWSSPIDPTSTVQIEPVRGQMLCFLPDTNFARHVIYSSRGYLIPRRDGRLIAGSTSERAGFDKRVTAEGVEAITSMAIEIAPEVANLSLIDSWAGFRPRAHDNLPVLGMSPDIDGLFYATGHYRNGILLAPISAELLADAVSLRRVSPLLAPFLPRSDARTFSRSH
jgi:glycine oxidase